MRISGGTTLIVRKVHGQLPVYMLWFNILHTPLEYDPLQKDGKQKEKASTHHIANGHKYEELTNLPVPTIVLPRRIP